MSIENINVETLGKDQVVVTNGNEQIFTSYGSKIAKIEGTKVTIGRDFEYSRTTQKYLKQFLGVPIATTRKNIKSGLWEFDENLH